MLLTFFGPEDAAPQQSIAFNPIEVALSASPVVKAVTGALALMVFFVITIGVLKLIQLWRLRANLRAFEEKAHGAQNASDLYEMATSRGSAGARVVYAIYTRVTTSHLERLRAVADRAIVDERKAARGWMWLLGFVGAAAPFIGLFGTVYGIMDAFRSIGLKGNASLPVVAPAIGEALITTAIGLVAAIPAVFFFNIADRMIGDFVAELEASASEWVALINESRDSAIPLTAPSRGATARYAQG